MELESIVLFIMLNFILLNHVRAWLLKIVSVWMSVYVYVCVSAPEAINN